jgi:hypothetical protein
MSTEADKTKERKRKKLPHLDLKPGWTPWRQRDVLTPKFGKEYDMWVRFEKESVWWKERYFQRFSAEGSAVGYLLQFGKRTVELILRDWTVTWLNQRKRMDG